VASTGGNPLNTARPAERIVGATSVSRANSKASLAKGGIKKVCNNESPYPLSYRRPLHVLIQRLQHVKEGIVMYLNHYFHERLCMPVMPSPIEEALAGGATFESVALPITPSGYWDE
jgi:hypothetical protein